MTGHPLLNCTVVTHSILFRPSPLLDGRSLWVFQAFCSQGQSHLILNLFTTMRLFASIAALVSITGAAVLPSEQLNTDLAIIEQRNPQADSDCTNGALTRACWSDGYSIATDFDQKHPTTGVTVTYDLTITNTTCNPDGHGDQTCYLINGVYPGPVITANW